MKSLAFYDARTKHRKDVSRLRFTGIDLVRDRVRITLRQAKAYRKRGVSCIEYLETPIIDPRYPNSPRGSFFTVLAPTRIAPIINQVFTLKLRRRDILLAPLKEFSATGSTSGPEWQKLLETIDSARALRALRGQE